MKIFIVAGDPSGDLQASYLVESLKKNFPSLKAYSAGGENLARVSTSLIRLTNIAVTGISEALGSLKKILNAFNFTAKSIQAVKPDIVILVDFPDFNLRLAKKIASPKLKIVYFISPQLWAWRPKRIKIIKKYVDKMLVTFPFEKDFYQEKGLDACFVGHPLVNIIEAYQKKPPALDKYDFKINTPFILLLPGSRKKEIKNHLPTMLETKKQIEKSYKCRFILIKHPNIEDKLFNRVRQNNIRIIEGFDYGLGSKARLAIASSGTAALELALLEVPAVILYRLETISYLFLRQAVQIKNIAMPNIILKETIYPEFIQNKATPGNISESSLSILRNDRTYETIKNRLSELKKVLSPFSPQLAAEEILRLS